MKQAKLNFSSAPRAAEDGAGSSRSARKSRAPLKQARITSLESPVRAIAQSIYGRRTPRDRTSPQNVVTIDDSRDPDDELVASGNVAAGSSGRPIDVDNVSPVAAQSSAPPSSKKRKRRSVIQRKLDFGDKTRPYVGVEPNSDSEEEAFHATQLGAAPTPTRDGQGKSLFSESDDDDEGQVAADGAPAETADHEEDDSDDSDAIGLPSQRRKRYLKQLDERESAASAEDDEVSEAEAIEQHVAQPTKKQTFRSNLERLRRRKQGLPTDSEPEDDDNDDNDDYDDDVNKQNMDEYGGDDDDDWIVDGDEGDGTSKKSLHELFDEAEGPRTVAKDSKRKSKASGKRRVRSVFADDGENDGLALFRQRRSPQELFKICVQYEVLELVYPQEGVAPEPYFRDAIDWLRDRTQGKGEIAKSSVWGQDFTSALSRFPQFEATPGVRGIEIDAPKGDWCDACRRTNRPASWTLKFQGSRYDRLTLEEIDDDTDSEEELAAEADTSQSESDGDHDDEASDISDLDAGKPSRSQISAGKKRARNAPTPRKAHRTRAQRLGQGRPFQLGQNCFARAEVVHELIHLRRHLRDAVAARLTEESAFMRRDRTASHVEKQRLANDLTDTLDRTRFTIRLWHRFRAQIERGEELIVGADRVTSRRRL